MWRDERGELKSPLEQLFVNSEHEHKAATMRNANSSRLICSTGTV